LRNDPIASRTNDPFPRSSAAAAQQRLQTTYVQEMFNAGAPVVLADRSVTLDDYVTPAEHAQVDFIKIDTDGHDIEVVLGSEQIVNAGGALGFCIEAQFHGPTHDYANTFSNLDRFMRTHGFTLFALEAYRYSRTALPAPFVYDFAAQTISGQHLWGDAYYFRDLADPDYERKWPPYAVTRERTLKLACLFDLFDVPDCAAELLINRASLIDDGTRTELLDRLASGEAGSYAAAVRAFEEDFTALYPSRRAPASREQADRPSAEVEELRTQVEQLKKHNRLLRDRVRDRDERLQRVTHRLEKLKDKRQAAAKG